MSKHIIELNGKRYDAITGKVLGASGAAGAAQVAARRAARAHQGRVIDGIVGPARTPANAAPTVKPVKAAAKPQSKAVAAIVQATPKKPQSVRATAKALAPHEPQRPKTLMRSAVKKPHIAMKPAIKVQAPAEVMAKPDGTIALKRSVNAIDPHRSVRAKHIAKNHLVQRFGNAETPAQKSAMQPRRQAQPVAVRPTQYASATARPMAATTAVPKPAATPQQPANDIFEAALAHATSHQQAAPTTRKRRSRLANVMAGIAAFILIGGFVAYLNMANIEVHVASMRAGFSAQIPGYKPVGYALGGIKSQDGKVSVSFRSGDASYTISQQASDWNSETLLDNAVALSSTAHQTIESKGRTIYLYDNNRAAWVNGGVRYDLTGNATLTPSDVAAIASSM